MSDRIYDVESLLNGLERLVARKTAKSFSPEERDALGTIIVEEMLVHDGGYLSWSDQLRCASSRDLRDSIDRVVRLLQHDANWNVALVALGAVPRQDQEPVAVQMLGATVMTAPSPDSATISRAAERFETLLSDLDAIARALPPPPRRGRGRPSKTKNLRALVDRLASFWEEITGQPFKQGWHEGDPLTPAVEFVRDAVKFIDSEFVAKLPKVTEKVVATRRAAASRK